MINNKISLTDIPFKLDIRQLASMMRIQEGSENFQELEHLVTHVQSRGKPKAGYHVSYIEEKGDDFIIVDGVRFNSLALRKNLANIERIFPYIATCGSEMDDIELGSGDLRKKMWISFIKGNMLLSASNYLQEHIIKKYGIPKLAFMNPGSGDASIWPIEEQRQLFSLLGDVAERIGVKLTKSFILSPDMSVSGIMFPSEVDFQTCKLCHRENCLSRRAPFDQKLWDSINE